MRLLLFLTFALSTIACAPSVRTTFVPSPLTTATYAGQVTNKMNLVIHKERGSGSESVAIPLPRTTGIGDVVITQPVLVLSSDRGEFASDRN